MIRILVCGKDGQLATCLNARASKFGIKLFCFGRPEVDLTIPETIFETIAATKPDIVVNVAAFTNVDLAEDMQEQAMLVNGEGARLVSEACFIYHLPIIHISTDYVFDGENIFSYNENDITAPIGAYGRSKLLGEDKVIAANPRHIILRTSWVYSEFGKNFLKTMLNLAQSGKEELRVVEDQFGNPTYAMDLADAIIEIAQNITSEPDEKKLYGIFHLAGTGATNWANFAAKIFEASQELDGPFAKVVPIPTSEYPTKAVRPKNSRLDCAKIANIHGIIMPDWETSTKTAVNRYLAKPDWAK